MGKESEIKYNLIPFFFKVCNLIAVNYIFRLLLRCSRRSIWKKFLKFKIY